MSIKNLQKNKFLFINSKNFNFKLNTDIRNKEDQYSMCEFLIFLVK